MRDAVLIVCGGLFQVPAVEIAHELGYDIVHHRLELYGRKRRAG